MHQNMEDGFVRDIRFILYALVYMKIFRNFAMSKPYLFQKSDDSEDRTSEYDKNDRDVQEQIKH